MIKLIKPSEKYFLQYKEMMDEWLMEGSRVDPWSLDLKYHTKEYFKQMLKRVQEAERGENIGEYPPSTTYWLYDDEKDIIIGCSNLRHYLRGDAEKIWGHIGYGIRPSQRRKGYGIIQLEKALEKCNDINIDKVLITCNEENIASAKTIEKCYGEYENTVHMRDETLRRYWITLSKINNIHR